MTRRSRKNQTCHDSSIRRRAAQYESYGWDVEADLPDYKKPPVLKVDGKGVKPDLIVRKGKRTKIIEVETIDSKYKDKEQHKLLRKYGRSQKNTEVNVRTCYE